MLNKRTSLALCLALLGLFGVGLTGCVNLKPKSNMVKLYALGPSSLTLPDAVTEGSIYIARPDLPVYLDGKSLQYRDDDGEVRSLRSARWAEPLQEGVARALAEYLIQTGGHSVSGFYPWPSRSSRDLELRVHFHKLGLTSAGQVQMLAQWELRSGSVTVRQGSYASREINWKPGDAESLVAAVNQALSQLAGQIGATL